MKTIRRYLLLTPFLALAPLQAQDTNIAPPPPPAEQPGEGRHGHGPKMGGLSEAERAQVKAAHDKAVQENPALQQNLDAARTAMEQARNAAAGSFQSATETARASLDQAHKALNDAMVRIDPTVAPLLAKMRPAGMLRDGKGGPGMGRGGRGGPGMANLTEAERTQLKAAREQAQNDPAVVTARDAMKAASDPEARKAAQATFRQAMHDAMIKADPTVAPIFEKMHPKGAPDSSEPTPPAPPAS